MNYYKMIYEDEFGLKHMIFFLADDMNIVWAYAQERMNTAKILSVRRVKFLRKRVEYPVEDIIKLKN